MPEKSVIGGVLAFHGVWQHRRRPIITFTPSDRLPAGVLFMLEDWIGIEVDGGV